MKKKILSLVLCGVIFTAPFMANRAIAESFAADMPATMPAESGKASKVSAEPAEKALEAAILAVKSEIEIPKEYSEFEYYFSGGSTYGNSYFTMTWRNPKDYSYIEVSCDQNNHITYYNKYDYSRKDSGVPQYLKKELMDEADAFIRKIAPDIYSRLELTDSYFEGIYSQAYVYQYQRKEGGVSFPDNTVTVWVNADTGEIRTASVNWLYDTNIPSSGAKLTKDEAAQILSQNMKMKLVYRYNYYRIYDNGSNTLEKKAYLVYEPDPGYISIDAKTGEVYLTRSEWINEGRGAMNGAVAEDSAVSEKEAAANVALTEAEIEKIRELEKLISKDKAISLVTDNPYLYIDEHLQTYTATLNKTYATGENDATYVWNIDLRDARPVDYEKDKDYYRAFASAVVDAKTGKILNFYSSVKSNYDEKSGTWKQVKIPYDREEARTVLEKFLKNEAKDRFGKTKLVEQRDDYVAYYKENNVPVYGGYYYKYNRFNEEVEFTYNGIYGAVDGVTGKIYSYRTNWDDDIVFESPKKAMTPEEAFEKYISKEGYHLVYEVNEINKYDPEYKGKERYNDASDAYSLEHEVRLVYRPDIVPPYISPFTGEQLNGDGTVLKTELPYVYKDIADTKENREILLLSDMNIGFEGEYFHPGKEITKDEFSQLLQKLGYGYYDEGNSAVNSTSPISREEAAILLIEKLGLKKLADIKSIFTTGYSDEVNINPDYIGAVALAKGLGLMGDKESSFFYPKNNVTRAEAVHLLLNYIRVERERNYY